MPTYEYACGACGNVSEINHRMTAPTPTDCPQCGKPALSKLMSASSFRLKGSGWYETDFKSEGKRNLAGDAPPAEKASGEAASAAPSKPAASTPAENKTAEAPKSEAKPKAESKPKAAPAPSKPASSSGAAA